MTVWRLGVAASNNKIASVTRTETTSSTTPIAVPPLKKEVVLLGEAINDVKDERNGIYRDSSLTVGYINSVPFGGGHCPIKGSPAKL